LPITGRAPVVFALMANRLRRSAAYRHNACQLRSRCSGLRFFNRSTRG